MCVYSMLYMCAAMLYWCMPYAVKFGLSLIYFIDTYTRAHTQTHIYLSIYLYIYTNTLTDALHVMTV